MVSHCVIIQLTILIPVIINFLTIFPNNENVSVLLAFVFGPDVIFLSNCSQYFTPSFLFTDWFTWIFINAKHFCKVSWFYNCSMKYIQNTTCPVIKVNHCRANSQFLEPSSQHKHFWGILPISNYSMAHFHFVSYHGDIAFSRVCYCLILKNRLGDIIYSYCHSWFLKNLVFIVQFNFPLLT